MAIGALIEEIVAIAGRVARLVADIGKDDDAKREAYTKGFTDQFHQAHPDYNVVLCHPPHTVSPSGGYVVHHHTELPISLGRTIGYDIYAAPKGKPFTFVNQGDGGFINWAYNGDFNRDGHTLTAKH